MLFFRLFFFKLCSDRDVGVYQDLDSRLILSLYIHTHTHTYILYVCMYKCYCTAPFHLASSLKELFVRGMASQVWLKARPPAGPCSVMVLVLIRVVAGTDMLLHVTGQPALSRGNPGSEGNPTKTSGLFFFFFIFGQEFGRDGRERKRERQTDRQTDRLTDKQTDR